MTAMLPHFFLLDQLRLLVGSSRPSKSTISGYGASVCDGCASFLLDVELLLCASRSASSSSNVSCDPFSVFSSRVDIRSAGSAEDISPVVGLIVDAVEIWDAADSYSEGARECCRCSSSSASVDLGCVALFLTSCPDSNSSLDRMLSTPCISASCPLYNAETTRSFCSSESSLKTASARGNSMSERDL